MFNFINRLFKKDSNDVGNDEDCIDDDNYITLLDIVEKVNDLEEGIFANINNDIAYVNYLNYANNVKMTYAYVRRLAAAGLFLQGIFSEDDYLRASMIFKNMQIITYAKNELDNTNYYFQEKCAKECEEFVQSYDKRLTKEFYICIMAMVETNEDRNSINKIYDYDTLVDTIIKIQGYL